MIDDTPDDVDEPDLDELIEAMPRKMRHQILRQMSGGDKFDREYDEPDESWRDVLPTGLPPPPPVTYYVSPERFAEEARRAFAHIDVPELPELPGELDA